MSTERTEVLAFIEADIAKVGGAWRPLCGLGVVVGMAVVALGFGWRNDYADTTPPSRISEAALWLLVLLTGLVPMVWAWPRQPERWRVRGVAGLVALAVGVSLLPGPTARSVTEYGSGARFFSEAVACLGKGLIAAAVAGVLGGWLVQRWLPLPSRRLQIVGAMLPGLAAASMLALHCSGTAAGHVLLGHWGVLLVLLPVLLPLQRRLVGRAIRRALGPQHGANLRRLDRLAD